jgi:hypothetical protein
MLGDMSLLSSNSSTSPNLTFENEFRHRWGQRLAQFDDLSNEYQSQEKLFEQVIVCGNLYAVCKKLENLLRTSGLSEMIKQVHETESPRKEMKTKILLMTEGSQVEEMKISHKTDSMTEIQPLTTFVQSQETNEIARIEIPLCDKSFDHDDDDDDDDDALLPGSNDIFTTKGIGFEMTEQQSHEPLDQQSKRKTKPSSLSTKSLRPPQGKMKRNSNILPRNQQQQLQLQQQQQQQQLQVLKRIDSGNGNIHPKKITDIFHSIAELFPAVQGLLRNLQRSG